MRTALAYLRIAQHPDRIARADIVETVHRPSRKISRNVAETLTKRPHTSVSDIRRLAVRLSGGDVGRLLSYAKDLEHVAGAGSTAEALRRVRLWVGLGASMDELDSSQGEVDRSTHADDLLASSGHTSARATFHHPGSVNAYLRDFDAVLICHLYGMPAPVIASVIHKGLSFVAEYLELVDKYLKDAETMLGHLRERGVKVPLVLPRGS
jgi:hypothetical protein